MRTIPRRLIAAAALATLAGACTTTKPATEVDETAEVTEAVTEAADEAKDAVEDAYQDQQTGKIVEGLGALLYTAKGELAANHFVVTNFPKDHSVFESWDETSQAHTYVILDGGFQHVATLVERAWVPERPFPAADGKPDASAVTFEAAGPFAVAESETTAAQTLRAEAQRASFASMHYSYELTTQVDMGWFVENFAYRAPNALACAQAADCPIQVCDCGAGVASAERYPCAENLCALDAVTPCSDLCETIDFGETE